MTAQEKAKELIEKFATLNISQNKEYNQKTAKQCAIICVEELIDSYGKNKEFNRNLTSVFNFWNEVKSELEQKH